MISISSPNPPTLSPAFAPLYENAAQSLSAAPSLCPSPHFSKAPLLKAKI
jgi:hypothetical protein